MWAISKSGLAAVSLASLVLVAAAAPARAVVVASPAPSGLPSALASDFNGDDSFHEQKVVSPTFAGWAAGASPVALQPPPEILGTMSILDTEVVSGVQSSIAVGTDGLGIISYYEGGSGDGQNLRVAHCLDEACTAVTATNIDTLGDVGQFSSIKIGRDGLPLISYVQTRIGTGKQTLRTEDLKVAHCNDVACTSATVTTLVVNGKIDGPTALTIGGDGLGLISFQQSPEFTPPDVTRVRVAHCSNTACTSATRTTIDTVGSGNSAFGGHTQGGIATGNHGLGLLSYHDGDGPRLKVAACTNPDCSATVITVVDRAADPQNWRYGGYSSVTFGSDGLALISYYGDRGVSGGDLKVAHCLNVQCTASTSITADTGGNVGSLRTSAAVAGDGLGVISYYDFPNHDLKLAHCANLACSAATTTTVDSFDDVGRTSSVTVGADGRPLISYVGPGFIKTVALRVVRCGNADCTAIIVAPF